ncbi:hypothetical protein JTE90_013360 [Oedothorax gibbosus]|uniref:Uncharacterized protein n=1 Tax=Oedothorax gibbosus TaxID=931172 RepID=A0AAV6TWH3_9ARAC|nr:hypothetical protein JTE90_013360 [Oedothorax gibbosus]
MQKNDHTNGTTECKSRKGRCNHAIQNTPGTEQTKTTEPKEKEKRSEPTKQIPKEGVAYHEIAPSTVETEEEPRSHKNASSQKRAPQSERKQSTNQGDGRRNHKSASTRQVALQNNCNCKKK